MKYLVATVIFVIILGGDYLLYSSAGYWPVGGEALMALFNLIIWPLFAGYGTHLYLESKKLRKASEIVTRRTRNRSKKLAESIETAWRDLT